MNLEVIKFLIEHGANKNFKDSHGDTAYDFAKRQENFAEIEHVLENTGKK